MEIGAIDRETAEPIDNQTAEKWIGIYIEDYGELPTETYEKSTHRKLETAWW